MELLENIKEGKYRNQCRNFINKQKNTKINLKPLFNKDNLINEIKEKIDNDDLKYELDYFIEKGEFETYSSELLYWRYYCSSDKDCKLLVLLDEEIKKDFLFSFSIDISEKALKYIELQINFMKMEFDEFMEYLFNNADYYSKADLTPFGEHKKIGKLNIYVLKEKKKKYKKEVFFSENFYELVEGSKIFLHYPNYYVFENQLSYVYGKQFDKTIKIFYRIRFLKEYLYKTYSLLELEYFLISGSFMLFAFGFRTSRDTDIYFLQNKFMKEPRKMSCDYNTNIIYKKDEDYSDWNFIFLFPQDYYLLFGLKTNSIVVEVSKRNGRYNLTKSHKALADLIMVKYYLGENTNIDLNKEKELNRLLHFRYKNFEINKIKNHFKK